MATSASSETKLSFSIKVIFSLNLVFSERKGLIVCQNFLLSVISFWFKLVKKNFFSFRNWKTHQFLCLLYEDLFSVDGSLKNLFLNFVLCIIALDRHTGIPGPWTQELDAGLWTLDTGLWTLGSGLWTLGSGRWTLDAGLWTLDAGRWNLYAGSWNLDAGSWTLDHGRWILDAGLSLWTLDATLWTLDSGHWSLSLTVLEQNQKPVSDSAFFFFFFYKMIYTMNENLK